MLIISQLILCSLCFNSVLTKKIHSSASRAVQPSRSQYDQRYRRKKLWRPQPRSWRTPRSNPGCSTWWLGQSLFSTSIFALNWSFSSMMLYMSYSATSALSSGSCVQIVLCNTFWGRICRKDILNCQDLYNFSNTSPKLWWVLALWRYNWAESKQLESRRLSTQTPSRCTCMRCRQQYHCSSVDIDHW